MSFFTFSTLLKSLLSPQTMGIAKSSRSDYKESSKPNLKSLAHTGSEKELVQLGVPKNELSLFSHFLLY